MELSAGGDHELWAVSTFRVEIVLTKKGLENYERVIEACFQYGKKLKEAGPQEWVFNECLDLGKMQFEFQDKGNPMHTCIGLSSKMQLYEA